MTNFIGLVSELAGRNDISMKPEKEIDFGNLNIEMLDKQARRLADNEVFVFIDGEESESDEITEKHGLEELNRVLNRIFDGELYEKFYYT